jgi:uncharacterized SAM-dependent methyltransferase
MQYFKNTELAKLYGVSEKSVRNWIQAAVESKLELQLHTKNDKTYIANTSKNTRTIEALVEKGKKYKNSRGLKQIAPLPKFYDLYSRKQILDIITSLSVHREIPRQYNYFDGGANNWDNFAKHQWDEISPTLLKSTVSLLKANINAIDLLVEGREYVNVIDIGPGNGVPVKELLEHLLKSGKLHRYIAIDISEAMLKIAEKNIKKWFGDAVKFEGYVKDITHERFDDLLVDDMLNRSADRTVNLALLLGATPMNFREPYDILKVICKSLSRNDLLVYTDKPDTEAERRSFDVNADPPAASALSPKYSFIFDLLNIDESLYDVEMAFNGQKRVRYIRVRLKVAVTINFKFKDDEERNVDLQKGDTILLWRVWHRTVLELISEFEESGFSLLQSSLTKDRQYLLTISGVDSSMESDN